MTLKTGRLLILCLVLLVSIAIGAGLFIRNYTGTANAATFTYRMVPADGGVIQSKQPELQVQLTLPGETLASYQLYLDGQAIAAAYQPELGLITGRPPQELQPGRHNLSLTFVLTGYQPVEISSSFTIEDKRSEYQSPGAGTEQSSLLAAGLNVLNQYRTALALPPVTEQSLLTRSAQAHADYLARNRLLGHYEDKSQPGFTGATVKERAELAGYYQPVGEGLSTAAVDGGGGVDSLMDAPYHRLAHINPNFTEVGMGFTLRPDCTVINYGAPQGLTDGRIVVYPYPGQTDAKIGWKAVETPNPLAAYGQEETYVGYPISLSVHDSATRELQVLSASLATAGGQPVPFFLVDASKESAWKQHVFLIPRTVLVPGMAYTARIESLRLMADGSTATLAREWTFATLPNLEAASASLGQMSNGADFVSVKLKNGELADLAYTVKQGGQIWQTYQDGRYLRYNPGQPLTGTFTLELTSSLFPGPVVYEFEMTGNEQNRQLMLR
ncbi:CAP domain-containing protein [Sporomusa termitida]|uniref:Cysteine-rich secretory protein family protein n=1 Tax=Sporomusa termitida TaxID=2377 RepID=A0A517E0J2_9FIRM|nr:CAP domain-containing protein [Sporomusa termitida]QDR83123.1 Cysteine-rich secretory protein family protein [Sporomusa termitida]